MTIKTEDAQSQMMTIRIEDCPVSDDDDRLKIAQYQMMMIKTEDCSVSDDDDKD